MNANILNENYKAMSDNRYNQGRDFTDIENRSMLPADNCGLKSAIKGEDGKPLPLRGEDGIPTVYGLLVAFGQASPPAVGEQVKYKSATMAVWANRESAKMAADEDYTPQLDRDGNSYIFNEDSPPASIAAVDAESARSQAYNRRHRQARKDIQARKDAVIAKNRKDMAIACYNAALQLYGDDSPYTIAAAKAMVG